MTTTTLFKSIGSSSRDLALAHASRSPERYQIIQKVGRGKYSEVFKAIDMKTGEPVSIKYLKPVRKKKIRRYVAGVRGVTL